MRTSIWLVRHGQTELNKARRYQGSTDSPLTPFGTRQVAALAQRLRRTPFKLAVVGPSARARHTAEAILGDREAPMLDDQRWAGPVNATAPEPVTNAAFSKALGRALHRPTFLPIPGFAVRILYGDMAEIVVKGQRAVPQRTTALGYRHQHPDLDQALKSALERN